MVAFTADNSVKQDITQHDSFIVILVTRRMDQRQRPLPSDRPKLAQKLFMLQQFGAVAVTEFFPSLWIVTKPVTELRARRDLLHPPINGSIGLAYAARPEAIHYSNAAFDENFS